VKVTEWTRPLGS